MESENNTIRVFVLWNLQSPNEFNDPILIYTKYKMSLSLLQTTQKHENTLFTRVLFTFVFSLLAFSPFLLVLHFSTSVAPRPLLVTQRFNLAHFPSDAEEALEVLTCPVLFHTCETSTFSLLWCFLRTQGFINGWRL